MVPKCSISTTVGPASLTEELDRVLVAEVVRPLHRVVDVGVDGVVLPDRRVDASLGGSRVGAERVELRNDGDIASGFDRRERRALSREPRSDHDDVVLLHDAKNVKRSVL